MAKNRKNATAVAVSPVSAEVAEVAVVAASPEVHAILAVPSAAPAEKPAKAISAKKWPKVGGKCWAVWQQCQQLADSGQHVNVGMLREWAIANSANVSNATQEFYAWRRFVSANS